MNKPVKNRVIGIRPCTWVYVLLMGFTCLTWAVGVSGAGGITVALLILGLSLFKGHLIADYYMGLKMVSGMWRWIILAWLMIPGTLIGLAFYLA